MRFIADDVFQIILAALLSALATASAADPVGPFLTSHQAYRPSSPQPSTIARDGTVAQATALSGDSQQGRLRLELWSGDQQAGGRGADGVCGMPAVSRRGRGGWCPGSSR